MTDITRSDPTDNDHIRDSYLDALAMVRACEETDAEAAQTIWDNCCKPCIVSAMSDLVLALCERNGITFRVFQEECMRIADETHRALRDGEE